MQSIIDEAKQYSEYEEQLKLSQIALDDDFDIDDIGQARIVIVGCGGAGNNTINRLQTMGIDGAQTIAI
ncbi:MAG: cell division protein FtsZ, partial [Methanosarcinales archaeon]|nr:cell division protein FtsZ [Methanosarcinales archaeon]